MLAAIDDGVRTPDEALAIIRVFQEVGYKKMITTPHVMQDYYRNDSTMIVNRLDELKKYLVEQGVAFEIQAAAEELFSFLNPCGGVGVGSPSHVDGVSVHKRKGTSTSMEMSSQMILAQRVQSTVVKGNAVIIIFIVRLQD